MNDNASSEFIAEDETVEYIAGNLIDAVMTELRQLEKPWQSLSNDQQHDVLARVKGTVTSAVKFATMLIASQGFEHVSAEVDQVVFKDGVKVVLKSAIANQGMHRIAEHEGRLVTVVLADPEVFMGGADEDRTDKDQPDLEGVT